MKYTLFFIASLFFSNTFAQIEKIYLSQILEHQIEQSPKYNQVVNFAMNYIEERGKATTIEVGDSNIINFVKSNLFPSWLKDADFIFTLLSIQEFEKNNFNLKIALKTRYYDEEDKIRDFDYYIYNLRIIDNLEYINIDYNLRTENFDDFIYKKQYKYFVKPILNIDKIQLKKVSQYCDSISTIFYNKNYSDQLLYIPTNLQDAFKIFGFDYCLMATGRYFPNFDMIISVNETFFDKHELVHAILKNEDFAYFISEGIATYFGGSNNKTLDNFKSDFRNKVWSNMNETEKNNMVEKFLYSKDDIMTSQYYTSFLYICSAFIIREVINTNGIEALTKIARMSEKEEKPNDFLKLWTTTKDGRQFILNLFNEL